MKIALGIDTGGTYTDAVLVNHTTGEVLGSAKALTTRHDLSIGIREASSAVFAAQSGAALAVTPADVVLVGLSTTLATNSVVEGQGGTVALLLMGYDRQLMLQYGFERDLGTADFAYIDGGHDGSGDETAPLDEEALRQAVLVRRGKVEAFAVSGYFSVRNPSHELRARALIEELAGVPVTCGHELSSRLNAVRRATTAALNARLIGLLRDLILTVQRTLGDQGIWAPLMVVKGDGSLVEASWAMHRPIETVLSGPAASVVGAWHLAARDLPHDRGDAWVVDVGGTTTDIAGLRNGLPLLNVDGARVGGWRTMVEAIDVHTAGLGGDSHVRPADGDESALAIGPRRVVPLALLASTYPQVVEELRWQLSGLGDGVSRDAGEFVMAWRPPVTELNDRDREVLDLLARGPRSLAGLIASGRGGALLRYRVEDLAARGLVQRAGFTPTDALHVLGRFNRWDVEAARLGAELLAYRLGTNVDELCGRVVAGVARRVATELVSKVLEDETGSPISWEREPAAATLLSRGLDGAERAELDLAFTLRRPIVAIGAPVAAYLPQTAACLHTDLLIPGHADVANALGAVAGGIVQRVTALINPLPPDGTRLRLFLPDGYQDFDTLHEAVAYAEPLLESYAADLARQAGAGHVEVRVERRDNYAHAGGSLSHEIFLGTELIFIAAGRPAVARKASR